MTRYIYIYFMCSVRKYTYYIYIWRQCIYNWNIGTPIWNYTCMNAMGIYTCIRIRSKIYLYLIICVYTYIYSCNTHTYIHTYIYICQHVCVCVFGCKYSYIYNPSPSDKIIHIHIYIDRERERANAVFMSWLHWELELQCCQNGSGRRRPSWQSKVVKSQNVGRKDEQINIYIYYYIL